MSHNNRTVFQAAIGQKIDGQLHQLLAEYERPLQQKLFAHKQLCSEAERLNPDLVGENRVPLPKCEDLEDVYASASEDLTDKAETHRVTKKSLRAAQLFHGYAGPKSLSSLFQTVLVLGIAIFGDALINASFFSNAHIVAGPKAALITSFLISLTNVTVCACAGFFIGRYRTYGANALEGNDLHFKRKRVMANALHKLFLCVMSYFHLTVGLVRSQESIDRIDHSFDAYLNMLQTPEAVFLILIGVCMSAIAFHKGQNSIDCPHPEIGELQRAEESTKQEVHNSFDFYQGVVVDHFERGEKALRAPIDKRRKSFELYNKAVSACCESRQGLERAVSEAERLCRGKLAELITTYGCVSGEDQNVPLETLRQMVSFEHYLDIEIPAYRAAPEVSRFKSELLLEKNLAVKRLSEIFFRANHPNGEIS